MFTIEPQLKSYYRARSTVHVKLKKLEHTSSRGANNDPPEEGNKSAVTHYPWPVPAELGMDARLGKNSRVKSAPQLVATAWLQSKCPILSCNVWSMPTSSQISMFKPQSVDTKFSLVARSTELPTAVWNSPPKPIELRKSILLVSACTESDWHYLSVFFCAV